MVKFLPEDNRITISILFALSGIVFLLLFFDSHIKATREYAMSIGYK